MYVVILNLIFVNIFTIKIFGKKFFTLKKIFRGPSPAFYMQIENKVPDSVRLKNVDTQLMGPRAKSCQVMRQYFQADEINDKNIKKVNVYKLL